MKPRKGDGGAGLIFRLHPFQVRHAAEDVVARANISAKGVGWKESAALGELDGGIAESAGCDRRLYIARGQKGS